MNIFIPTYGRVNKQTTLAAIAGAWPHKKIHLVVRPEEAKAHKWPNIIVCDKKGVPAARQAAVEWCQARNLQTAFMFDDDLRFAVRPKEWCFETGETKLRKATAADIGSGLQEAERLLLARSYSMVGFDARGGNNQRPERFVKPASRIMRAFGISVPALKRCKIRFDRFPFWEDFHVALSLLEDGHSICNLMTITNDAQTNTAGGCSTYRNAKALRECLAQFVKLHKHVKPVEKTAKSWGQGMGQEAIPDMIVYWKKAAAEGGLQ